jgi:hypothetical protein
MYQLSQVLRLSNVIQIPVQVAMFTVVEFVLNVPLVALRALCQAPTLCAQFARLATLGSQMDRHVFNVRRTAKHALWIQTTIPFVRRVLPVTTS